MPARMRSFGRKTVAALALLWAWPLSVALAQTSPPTTTQIEVIDTGENEVEFADVLFTLAVGAQFPVTTAREYEWALTTSLKMEF